MWCSVNMQLVAYWAPINLYFCLSTLPCHASLNWTCIIIVCASCHVMWWLFTMLCASFRCLLLQVGSGNVVLWGPVRLCPFVFFIESFFFLAGSQARWSYPRNHFYLCFARCSLFCYVMLRCLPLAFKPPKLRCQTSNPPCPSKPLIGYVTALLSPSYSVASCGWRLETVPCWNIIYLLGYHYIAMLS